MKNTPTIRLINNASQYTERKAIVDDDGTYTYPDLLNRSANVALYLLDRKEDLKVTKPDVIRLFEAAN
ncbi:MAG TPA: hypothetical protein VLB01_08550 [Thermodesulfobacteriota bacterium]|nr:hypothetical protein [Thermodesulfobacteriota bacterium]